MMLPTPPLYLRTPTPEEVKYAEAWMWALWEKGIPSAIELKPRADEQSPAI